MIEIKLTVMNEETGFGRETKRTLTIDEFKHNLRKRPEEDAFKLEDPPIKGLFLQIAAHMTHDTITNKDEFLKVNRCAD